MDSRQAKGLQIAQTSRKKKKDNVWIVPSQSGHGSYEVSFNGHEPSCTCPDCETRQVKCKHIYAVEYVIRQEIDSEGNKTTTQTMKVTYGQDWSAYNAAQTQEGGLFMQLLSDLCAGVENKAYVFGRPKLPMADMVFASALKVYSTFSLRRFVSDMKIAKEEGFTDTICSYSSVSNYMRNPDMTAMLMELVKQSAMPLASVEKDFAVDSSGFSTCRFKRWYDFKYGREKDVRIWVKANVACGAKTNIITAVKLSESTSHDTNHFSELVENTAENFAISEVSADKAYSSRANMDKVAEFGGVPYIAYHKNARSRANGSAVWHKMFYYFMYRHDEFLDHYHKRSNVETTFSMVKRKFGDNVRSKDSTAQYNEVLLKVLCHNICVVIQEMFELGIMPQFCSKEVSV